MRRTIFLIIILSALTACPKKLPDYDAIGARITPINQKVAGHYHATGIPNNFDKDQYLGAVNYVCRNTPSCLADTKQLFEEFKVEVKKVNSITFSLLICEKNRDKKIMEDFSCNSSKVEVRTYSSGKEAPCKFEENWSEIIKAECQQ